MALDCYASLSLELTSSRLFDIIRLSANNKPKETTMKPKETTMSISNEDRVDAACKVLQIIRDSKQPVSAIMISAVVDLIRNAKTTKLELEAAIAKLQRVNRL